jgi:hypothetical protein
MFSSGSPSCNILMKNDKISSSIGQRFYLKLSLELLSTRDNNQKDLFILKSTIMDCFGFRKGNKVSNWQDQNNYFILVCLHVDIFISLLILFIRSCLTCGVHKCLN